MHRFFGEDKIISGIIKEREAQNSKQKYPSADSKDDYSVHDHSISINSSCNHPERYAVVAPSDTDTAAGGDAVVTAAESAVANADGDSDMNTSLKPVVKPSRRVRFNSYDMWALGITIVIGGQYFAWNEGLTAGFGSLAIATFLIATGYSCLILCIAELSSALPFAGGSYGIARVTVGIYPGFLVGCCDSIESVVYVAVAALTIGKIMTSITLLSAALEPLWWFLFYASAVMLQCWGGRLFWRANLFMAVVSFLIVLMFIFGAAKFADFSAYTLLQTQSGYHQYFQGGFVQFMHILPLPSWFLWVWSR